MSASRQIERAEKPVRRQRATGLMKPTGTLPSVAADPAPPERGRAKDPSEPIVNTPGLASTQTGQAAKPVRRENASRSTKPNGGVPSPNPSDVDAKADLKPAAKVQQHPRDGHCTPETQNLSAVAEIVSEITKMQRERRFCIKSQSRCDRSMEALIAVRLGYRGEDTPKNERAPFFKLAATIRRDVEKAASAVVKAAAKKESVATRTRGRTINPVKPLADPPGPADINAACQAAVDAIGPSAYLARDTVHLVPLSAAARLVWDKRRVEMETKMEAYARSLPIASWAQSIRGFGLLNLAIVCGEAGRPISDYGTVSKLWRRCGLAVINGERQRQRTGKEAGEEQKYNPKRRAEIYVVGSVSLFLAQKPGMRYRDIYDARRNRTAPYVEATADLPPKHPAKWSLKRCDNDARRIMTKSLLQDVWVEWRRLNAEAAT